MKRILFLLVGCVIGFTISSILGSFVFEYLTGWSAWENWNIFTTGSLSGKALAIGALPNIAVFYLFLNKEKYELAYGIILSFVIIAFYSFIF